MNKKLAALSLATVMALIGTSAYADPVEELEQLEQLEELVDQGPPAPAPMTICDYTATCTIVGSND